MIVDAALQGGGYRGCFTIRVCKHLEAQGVEWGKLIGTSVGAIVAHALRSFPAAEAELHFAAFRERDVMKEQSKWWALVSAAITKDTGLQSWTPLYDTLRRLLKNGPLPETWVTYIDYQTRQLVVDLATHQTTYWSALIPLVARYRRYADGGVREQLPLGKAIGLGFGQGRPIVVIMTSPLREMPMTDGEPHDLLSSIEATLDVALREVARGDIWPALLLNWLAEKSPDGRVPKPGGGWYYYTPIEIYAPRKRLPAGSLFGSKTARDEMFAEADAVFAAGPITDVEELLT